MQRSALVLRVVLGFATAGAAMAPAHVQAQDDAELDRLRKRFTEGLALEEEDRWQEALAIFAEIALVKTSPQVRYHVALCDDHLGHIARALTGYEEAIALAAKEGDAARDVAEKAPLKADALRTRVPNIRIVQDGDGVALLDGAPVDPSKLGAPIWVEPGKHSIHVRRASGTTLVRELDLLEGQRVTVQIPKPAAVVAPPKATAAPQWEPGTKAPAVIVGSAGIAALAGAAVMIGLRQSTIDEITSTCTDPDTLVGCDPGKRALAEDGETYEYAAIGLGAGGAALLGVAAVLWFTVGADQLQPVQGANTTLWIGVGPTGARVGGTF